MLKGKKKKERKRTRKHLFLHAGASGRQVEGNSREEALTSSSPHPSWALSSSKPEASLSRKKERGNDPSQTGSTARWPVAVYSKVGTVFSCRCVCVCVCVCACLRGFGLCWPTSGPAAPLCFSSLGQETAVEREAGVKVCAQPFEGYRALLANINQIAWSWAFTELEKPHHVSTFAQDAGSSTLSVTLDDTWPPPLEVDLVTVDPDMGSQGIFISSS